MSLGDNDRHLHRAGRNNGRRRVGWSQTAIRTTRRPAGLQPVSARHSSARSGGGDHKSSVRNPNHLRSLSRAVASLASLTYSNTQGPGNPPILQGSGYEAVRILGGLLNYDENISPLRNEACASCHTPYAGFSGPIPSVNLTMVAYPGTFHSRAGKRTAQRYLCTPIRRAGLQRKAPGVRRRRVLGCARDRVQAG